MGLRYCPKSTSGSNISTENDFAGISYKLRQQIKVQILESLSSNGHCLGLIYIENLPKNENVRKCRNNNSDNPLTSRRTDGGWQRKHLQQTSSFQEFEAILAKKRVSSEKEEESSKSSLLHTLASPRFLRPFTRVGLLMILAEFGGMNALTQYMVFIFERSGSSVDSSLAPIVVAAVRLAVGFIAAVVMR